MLRLAKFCKKCTIFGNSRTMTQERKKETRQMTPMSVCDIHFCIWKMSKVIFMGSPPLWPIRVCKIPEFWRWKLWDQPRSIQETYTLRKVKKHYFFNRVANQICLISWSICYGKCNKIGNYAYFPAVMYNF